MIPIHQAVNHCASEDVGLIFIDAHADLSDTFQGSAYSNGCPLRRAMELERFSPERTILVGTRCLEPAGKNFIATHNMKVFPAYEVAERGMRVIADEIRTRFSKLSNVYLSTLIRCLHVLPVVGADLVEVAPPLDVSDITSFAALRIITEIFALVQRRVNAHERITLL